jgi:protein-S-isoprenylcysteine O-methyltransferase Ste14
VSREWFEQNRALVRVVVSSIFAIVGVVAGFIVYGLEKHEVESVLILIVALVAPMALSMAFVTVLAVEWLVDRPRRDVSLIRTFPDSIKFAEFRRDIILGIKKINDPIYCTSHCNLFAYPGGRELTEAGATKKGDEETLKEFNREFFRKIAFLSMESMRGGLNLLLCYRDGEPKVKEELRPRFDIFFDVADELKREFNINHFDVRRLLQESLKDYLVIEDHVFKTIRKTPEAGNETRHAYVKNAKLADEYRVWLKDLFNNGDSPRNPTRFAEKTRMLDLYEEVKAEVRRERGGLKRS